MPQNTGNNVI